MAGSFGYHEGEHYDVSVKVAEHGLLPKLEEIGDDTLLIADGFSCRGQIEQLDGHEPLHVAQVVQRALRAAGKLPPAEPAQRRQPARVRNTALVAAVAAGAAIAGLAARS